VNPLASILAARMMLDWLGEKEKAAQIQQAVAEVVLQGLVRTYDMGGASSTAEMAQAVAGVLRPGARLHAGHLSTTWAWWRRVWWFPPSGPAF